MSKLWRGLSLALTAVLVATVLVAMPSLTDNSDADAANAAEFDPGYIISDENFYNGSAMTTAQISSWLKGKNAGCVSGKNCILNYTEHTPTMAADAYCGRLEGKSGESAASVIARVGKACDISQKALLVLLEKEQSLISLRDVPNWKWESATGYGCPDTAPCDAGFGGFFTQVYFGARAYQYYKAHPTQYRHQPMATNSVLYNPNSACGSSRVYIQNYATAGLYNYTPYQPNRAALNNLYGVGDSCSAYGNRNFWRMYSDWFGNPTEKSISPITAGLAKTPDSDRLWLISNGKRYPIGWESAVQYRWALGEPRVVSQSKLRTVGQGPWAGPALKSGSSVWLLDSGTRHEFTSCAQVAEFGRDCGYLPNVSSAMIGEWNAKGKVSAYLTWPGGGHWQVVDGQRHQVADAGAAQAVGVTDNLLTLRRDAVRPITIGEPLVRVGMIIHDNGSGEKMVRTKKGFVSLSVGQTELKALQKESSWVWTASMRAISAPTPLPDLIHYGPKHLVMTDRGLVHVDGGLWGKSTHFKRLWVPMLWGIAVDQPRVQSALLVQEKGASTVWLLQGGRKQSVVPGELADLKAKFGDPLVTASDTTTKIPLNSKHNVQAQQTPQSTVEQLESGALVESATSGEQFLYSESDGLVAIEDAAFAAALGIDAEPVALEDFELQLIGNSDTVLNTWGITCGGESYFAAGGELTLFAPDTLVHYPLGFVELPADICGTLAVSDAEIGKAVTDAAGQVWIIYEGRKHLASDEWLAENPPRTEPFALPAAYLKQVPTGTGLE
ncbi:hypothetical protein [Agrococcus casei]|uniref:Secreted protein n=1 Tax=Agrococcus casei LMG 22410 TaxID=1255656 RepID=A0A1R4F4Y9_9MICO|nr:hypothetical protein [Agrococcus casei]SJM50988.1 hypothetical protein CZ674_02615 [Agrococcus casei LMG 22410]